jgi:outer membrane protein TolC
MSRKKYLTTLAFITMSILQLWTLTVQAQEKTKELSLDEATTLALSNNRSVQLANADISIAAANYKQTEAIYLPQVGLSFTGMSTNNPLNAFGFKLQQKSISAADFNPALLNNPGSTPDFTTSLMVQQPLVNMDLVYQRKGAEKQIEVYEFKKQRTQEYISFEVKKAYLGLQLSYKAITVLEEALRTTKAVLNFTNNHYKQGLVQKSDVLNMQVQVAAVENNLAKARSTIRNASDYLSLLMGVPSGTVYTTTEIISVNEGEPVSELSASRSDFVAMKKAIEASDLMIRSGKMSYLPKLNAFGAYQLNDSRLLGFGAGAYLAGIRLSWDIFKGNTTKNNIATQTLERNKLNTQLEQQKEQSNTELVKAIRDLSDTQFEINQYTKAIEQASESLRILQNRYEQGLVNTTDIMMATSQLSQQKLSLAQAVYNKNLTGAYLQFITTSTHQ